MRKLLSISVTINLGLLVAFAWKPLFQSPTASAAGVVALKNGDANGDGKIDISDAIFLLGWLFQNGEPPVPIVPAGLTATGQTKCYDDQGTEIPCDSTAFPGQDGLYQAGCPT